MTKLIDMTNEFTKPLLAEDFVEADMVFPAVLSPKLDGIRAIGTQGTLKTRSMKDIPNPHIVERFKQYQGLDGEFIFGEPTAEDCYNLTYSAVMKTSAKNADGVRLFVFDSIFNMDDPFWKRYADATDIVRQSGDDLLVIVPQVQVTSMEDVDRLEAEWLAQGYEGWMYRLADGRYKQGRSTVKEGILLKGKRFKDSECVVLAVEEMLENQNEAYRNELGRTQRSSHKEGMVGKGTFGRALVRDIYSGVEFYIGGGKGMTKAKRAEIWADRENQPGQFWKYTYFPIGVVDKPRFPQWGGLRSAEDIDMEKAAFA